MNTGWILWDTDVLIVLISVIDVLCFLASSPFVFCALELRLVVKAAAWHSVLPEMFHAWGDQWKVYHSKRLRLSVGRCCTTRVPISCLCKSKEELVRLISWAAWLLCVVSACFCAWYGFFNLDVSRKSLWDSRRLPCRVGKWGCAMRLFSNHMKYDTCTSVWRRTQFPNLLKGMVMVPTWEQ